MYALKIKKNNFPEDEVEGEIDDELDDDDYAEIDDDADFEVMKRVKGVRRPITEKRIKFSDFEKTLYGKGGFYVNFLRIASKKHAVSTVKHRKRAMTAFDDKRWILPCRIHSFPYGSIEIEKFKGQCPTCIDV